MGQYVKYAKYDHDQLKLKHFSVAYSSLHAPWPLHQNVKSGYICILPNMKFTQNQGQPKMFFLCGSYAIHLQNLKNYQERLLCETNLLHRYEQNIFFCHKHFHVFGVNLYRFIISMLLCLISFCLINCHSTKYKELLIKCQMHSIVEYYILLFLLTRKQYCTTKAGISIAFYFVGTHINNIIK